jgi:hypothetical protein
VPILAYSSRYARRVCELYIYSTERERERERENLPRRPRRNHAYGHDADREHHARKQFVAHDERTDACVFASVFAMLLSIIMEECAGVRQQGEERREGIERESALVCCVGGEVQCVWLYAFVYYKHTHTGIHTHNHSLSLSFSLSLSVYNIIHIYTNYVHAQASCMFMCVCVMFVYVDKVIACAMFPCVRAQIHVVFLLSSVRLRHRRHGTLPFPRAPSSSYFYFSFVGLHFDAAAELCLPVPSHLQLCPLPKMFAAK